MAEITGYAARDFRIQLQQAREGAVKDAEAFDGIIHVVERLGSFCLERVACLGDYKPKVVKLATLSPLADELPAKWRNVHTPFSLLYDLVKDARNDAMHQGASARHLTTHAIELALVLEDALRMIENGKKDHLVSDYMVRDVVCAHLWQPISLVRQRMLTNSFTYLAVEDDEGQWCLLSDLQVAKYLQGRSNKERNKLLASPLKDAEIRLCPAKRVKDTMLIDNALRDFDHEPMLVFLDDGNAGDNTKAKLVGILTAFDLL